MTTDKGNTHLSRSYNVLLIKIKYFIDNETFIIVENFLL